MGGADEGFLGIMGAIGLIGLIGLIAPYSEVLLCGCWLWNEIAYLYLRFARFR
jgi:hypothetical protein